MDIEQEFKQIEIEEKRVGRMNQLGCLVVLGLIIVSSYLYFTNRHLDIFLWIVAIGVCLGIVETLVFGNKLLSLDKKKKRLARVELMLRDELDELESMPNEIPYDIIPYDCVCYRNDLNNMIGLSRVKEEIETLRNYVLMKKRREKQGLRSSNISYHCVFTGNPGTGKTTVARLLASIYKDLGVLKKGHLIETDRSGLVAEYVGQTAIKTNSIIDSALDGALFIDEAYTLANGDSNDFGAEAIATLLKRMEDNRDRLVVILAGYSREMENFINSNPGLRSRFNRYIHFDDYTADELYEIFCSIVEKSEYTLSSEASRYLKELLVGVVANKPADFGNARYVRNLFEKTIEAQANRLAKEPKLSKEDMTLITVEDLSNASR